jgi:hypothetical protein
MTPNDSSAAENGDSSAFDDSSWREPAKTLPNDLVHRTCSNRYYGP